MSATTTKSLRNIEEKMSAFKEDTLRYRILESAKNFKTSWIALGQALYSVWKDKLYKEWGYSTFDAYTVREIGIRKHTAMKLLRSYYFLEKEEPQLLNQNEADPRRAALSPNYEAIDVLRAAKKNKALNGQDYARFKEEVFEKGKDPRDVKKDLQVLIRERKELEPQEAESERKLVTLKRMVSNLKSLKKEIELLKFLPLSLIKETASLITKIEAEIK